MFYSQSINNSYISLSVLKVTSIPHISIIDGNFEQTGVYEARLVELKNSMRNVFDVIHSTWYTSKMSERGMSDTNIEFRWESTPVSGQTYLADINLYIIIRQRNIAPNISENYINVLTTNLEELLKSLKYETARCDWTDSMAIPFRLMRGDAVLYGLGKNAEITNLQNTMTQSCLFYDKYAIDNIDLRQLIATLSSHPGIVISILLTPTIFDANESNIVGQYSTILSNLSRGGNQFNINMATTNADKASEVYNYYFNNRRSSLFVYSICIIADRSNAAIIAPAVASQFKCGVTNLMINDLTKGVRHFLNSDFDLCYPWIVSNGLSHQMRQNRQFASMHRMPWIITSEEAAEIAYFPIGSKDTSAGLSISESSYSSKKIRKGLVCGKQEETDNDLIIGKLRGSADRYLKIPISDMAKHMFVAGTPGMGKSEFSTSVVHRLYEKRIPFLIIEPAKNEYRALSAVIPELQVFTPGKESISPFVANLFLPPDNVVLSSYKSTLKTFFEAAVSTSETLGVLYADAIDLAYSQFGWLDHHTLATAMEAGAKVFSLSDYIKCFEEVFVKRNYTERNRDILVAGKSRLAKLLRYFDSYTTIPVPDLLGRPTVIELNGIEHELDKGIVICYLLLVILSYVNSNYVADGKFRQCILLEEAHVILDTNRQHIEGQVDPAAVAKQLILRMLKELRSMGLGFIITDQSPSETQKSTKWKKNPAGGGPENERGEMSAYDRSQYGVSREMFNKFKSGR